VTKTAAEDLCELFHRRDGLACLVLRTSRFFPEADDDPETRRDYDDGNVKANEYLYRRVDLQDVVDATCWRSRRRGHRLRTLHHQRDDAVPSRRRARPAVGRTLRS
jgi:hypothetical protein